MGKPAGGVSMSDERAFEQGRRSLQRKRAAACLEALKRAAPNGSPTTATGYFLKGLVLEYGADGVQIDYAGSIDCYRRAARLSNDADAFPLLGIARVMLKRGGEDYRSALFYIQKASVSDHVPEVDLAFATYYEVAENDPGMAKKFYLKAAGRGRFAGFFGLASVLRMTGNNVQALAVDVIRLLVGPVLFVFLGRRARGSFNGY
jgi:TPR repeat protein